MTRREFLSAASGAISLYPETGLAQTLPARSRSAQKSPYSIYQELIIGDYLLKMKIEGVGQTVTQAIVNLFALPGKVSDPRKALEILEEKTGLIEPSDLKKNFEPIIYELGKQPRFVIITVPLGPRKRMRVRGDWWFYVDGQIVIGPDANAATKSIAPTSYLTVTLANGTVGQLV